MAERAGRQAVFHPDDPERSVSTLIEMSVATNLMIYTFATTNNAMGVYVDPLPGGTTLVNIQRCATRQEKRFKSIVRQFPHDWPIAEQGAYILRAFSGLQIFPDANHRTGLAMTNVHLRLGGHVLRATREEWRQLVADLKAQHGPYYSRCKADGIASRNACFRHVAKFFTTHTRKRRLLDTLRESMARRQGADITSFNDETIEAEIARKLRHQDDETFESS